MEHNYIVCANHVSPFYGLSYGNGNRNRIRRNDEYEYDNDELYGYGCGGYAAFRTVVSDIEVNTHFLREMNIEMECYED